MERRILFTDLDGTLLDKDKKVSQRNQDAIQRAMREGHKVTIATGRPLSSGRMIAHQIGLDIPGCYLISYNGGVIYDFEQEKPIRDIRMTMEDTRYLFERARQSNLYIHTYQGDKILAEHETEELRFYHNEGMMEYRIVDDVCKVLQRPPHKVLLANLASRGPLLKFQEENREWEKDKCISVFSSQFYLEYCPITSTKGDGVKFLADYLQVPIDHTVAAGDEQNDVTMIEAAGTGVVMKNANPEIFKYGNYRTENDNNNSGIAEVIEKFIL